MRARTAVAVAIAGAMVATPIAAAAPTLDGEYQLPQKPRRVAVGPDGNMWVTLASANPDVARVTPAGTVTAFDVTNVAFPTGIVAGPDGNLWVTQTGGVAKFSPADPATTGQAFPINAIASSNNLVTGPDGNLWTASDDKVVRIPPAAPATFQSFTVAGMAAREITSGSDGRLWVSDFGGKRVVSMTTAGAATLHDVTGGPQGIAAGEGGQVAYANPGATPHVVGRLVNGGLPATTNLPLTDPFGIAFGPDKAYWTAQFATNSVTRVAADGQATPLALPAASGPRYIAAGPNNTVWVTLETTDKLARITGVEPPSPADTTPPGLSGVAMRPATFRARRAVSAAGRRAPLGTTIRFSLTEPATVTLRFERALTGRVSAGRCVAPRPALGGAKRCVRFVLFATRTRAGAAGLNTSRLTGRIGTRRMPEGGWRMVVTARDSAGNVGTSVVRGFRVVR